VRADLLAALLVTAVNVQMNAEELEGNHVPVAVGRLRSRLGTVDGRSVDQAASASRSGDAASACRNRRATSPSTRAR
jgi:hypothetical protein